MCYHKSTGMYGKGHSKFSNIVPLINPLLFPPSNNKNTFTLINAVIVLSMLYLLVYTQIQINLYNLITLCYDD